MSLRVTFELEDKDLKYFKRQMNIAKGTAKTTPESEVIESAKEMMSQIASKNVPGFVRQRIDVLGQLVAMLEDDEWALAVAERKNVVSALAYFAEPQDIIPDDIPILGFIDDAIMIELVAIELKHELDAFNDFCAYRRGEAARKRNPNATREEYIDSKRRALHSRMRRRRQAMRSRGGAGRTRVRLF